jgi:hypothetical protein
MVFDYNETCVQSPYIYLFNHKLSSIINLYNRNISSVATRAGTIELIYVFFRKKKKKKKKVFV